MVEHSWLEASSAHTVCAHATDCTSAAADAPWAILQQLLGQALQLLFMLLCCAVLSRLLQI